MRIALLLSLLSLPALAEELAELDKPAPQFRLPVYNAKEFGESFVALDALVGQGRTDKDGKLLVVSFMASFCGPCKKEMPYLQKLYAENREKGLRVMMVAIDTDEEGQKKVEALVAENQVTFPVAKDRFNIVARRWLGAQSPLPSLFFVRTDGTIASVHRGYSQDGALVLAEEIEKVLGVKVSPPTVAPPPEPVDAGVPADEPAPRGKKAAKGAKPPKKKK